MSIPTLDICVKAARTVGGVVVACCFLGVQAAHAEMQQKLKDALKSDSPKVRIVAVSNLASSKDAGARAMIEPLLKDPDAAVRAAVVEGLGRIADPAALPALESLKGDTDPTVQKVLTRVLPALEALRVFVFIGKAEDFSGAGGDLADDLKKKTRAAIEKRLGGGFIIIGDDTKKAFGASPLAIRSVGTHQEGGNSFVDVKCELTLVDMPANILRAALSSTASVGVGGVITKKQQVELAHDAVDACAPELADDFASYVKEHARR